MANKPATERLEITMFKKIKDQMRAISTNKGVSLKALAIEYIKSGINKDKKLLEES